MKIRDLMIDAVVSCRADANVAAAGALMWQHDCGFLPVVDDRNRVIGVLTDRDICIALCTRNVRASELTAREVAAQQIATCEPEEDVRAALKTMRDNKVHRLPVLDAAGILQGIVSMDDILIYTERRGVRLRSEVTPEDVLQTLQAISSHHQNHPLVVSRSYPSGSAD